MKKICILMSDTLSYQTLAHEHLESLSQLETKVVCLYGGDYKRLKSSGLCELAEFVDVKFTRKPSLVNDMITLFKCIFHFMFNRYDVVVYSTPKAMFIGAIASFVTFHRNRHCLVRGRVYENYTSLKRKFFETLDFFSFLFSSKIYFISKSLMDEYDREKYFSIFDKSVIGNGSSKGVNTRLFTNILGDKLIDLKEKYGFTASDFIVCSVGRLCQDKGAKELFDTIVALKETNIKFLIVGQVEDEFGELVSNVKGNVRYIPHSDRVWEIFQCSDLNLFLSHREGFGNVAIESASCGVATLAFDVVGVRDSVANGITGLLYAKNNLRELIISIENIYNDSIEIIESNSCRDYIIDNFDSKVVCDEYINRLYLSRGNI
ncbi:glycosyltransferase [Vibrio breoganii]